MIAGCWVSWLFLDRASLYSTVAADACCDLLHVADADIPAVIRAVCGTVLQMLRCCKAQQYRMVSAWCFDVTSGRTAKSKPNQTVPT